MAIGTLFKSSTKDLLERIRTKSFESPEERKAAYEELALSTEVKPADAVALLFTPDHELRRAAGRCLAARKDPGALRLVLLGLRGRPDAARKAALATIASLPLGSLPAEVGRLMDDKDAQIRALGAETVFDLAMTPETVPLLTRIIEAGEAAHRLKAVGRFAEMASDRHLAFFEKLLGDPDERIRFASYQVLVKHAGPDKIDLLIRKVPDEPAGTQQLLIHGIQRLMPQAGPGAVDAVLGLLASGNTGLRNAALTILLAAPDRLATVRKFITYSLELAGWVRDRALDSMRAFGAEVLDPALELVGDADPEVRAAALTLLSAFDDPRVAGAAARLLDDPDWWLAINAAEILARTGGPAAVPVLVRSLARDDVRWAAADALGRIGGPAALEALARLTSDPRPEIRVEALAALAHAADPRVDAVLSRAAEGDAVKAVRMRAAELLRARGGRAASAGSAPAASGPAVDLAPGAPAIHALLAGARQRGASDLHVAVGSPPILRVHGTMVKLEGAPLDESRAQELLLALLGDEQRLRLAEERQLDACFYVPNDGRYRCNFFIDRKGLNGVFRVIPEQPPTVVELGLPQDVSEVATFHQGIVIVTGPSGCGKSTTLAALVNLVNETRRAHILTLEDPVEFVHPFKASLINHRDVGKHTRSFARALRAALREDPDVIVIGEMRDAETVTLALTAAETGHVVLTTLNATTTGKAVERVISSFPADEQPQVRESFAGSLKIVLAQTLLPRADGQGRVAAFEVLKGTHGVTSLIRDGKTYQLPSMLQIGASQGMRTFDDSLMQLVREGKVTPETAYLRATSKETFAPLVSPRFLEEALA